MFKRILLFSAALAVATASQAAVVGEVISGHDISSGKWVAMSAADGSQLTFTDCGGDLTHGGTPRFFVNFFNTEVVLPDGYGGNELIAYDEDCSLGVIITDEPSMRFNTVLWSPDGRRIAFYAETWDLSSGKMTEHGLYLADIVHDAGGRPVAATNLRFLFETGDGPISWSGDGSRIAHGGFAPDDQGGTQLDIWVYDLNTGTSMNVTNTPESNEIEPAFSPLGDRIAFVRRATTSGWYDIYTVPATGGKEVRVTTKKTTGQPANRHPCFSPDGQYLAFNSSDLSKFYTESRIFKIRSDGSGKAVSLYGRRGPVVHGHVWRQ